MSTTYFETILSVTNQQHNISYTLLLNLKRNHTLCSHHVHCKATRARVCVYVYFNNNIMYYSRFITYHREFRSPDRISMGFAQIHTFNCMAPYPHCYDEYPYPPITISRLYPRCSRTIIVMHQHHSRSIFYNIIMIARNGPPIGADGLRLAVIFLLTIFHHSTYFLFKLHPSSGLIHLLIALRFIYTLQTSYSNTTQYNIIIYLYTTQYR